MPVEFGLWRIDGGPLRLISSKLPDESRLETLLAQDISILGLGVMVISRQVVDASTERIVTYLSAQYGVPVNVLFFRYFVDAGHEYLARTWLIEPSEAEAHTQSTDRKRKETWNGQDFYVSFGSGEHRSWDDAIRYGFISGGQGRWYSKTLEALQPGHRVFVCIPGEGYVGVGSVKGTVQRVSDFTVPIDSREVSILDAPLRAKAMSENADDPEKSEYVVPVDWIRTRPVKEAVWEKGMFANQHTACALRNRFTLERLTEHFKLDQ